jgi:hypothetical protein
MIFPKFENIQIIDEIRGKYDPLANHVRPHITLVFPFDSDIGKSELEEHIRSTVSDLKPFEVVLGNLKPVRSFGNYLFLNIIDGSDNIKELHKRLYTGILESYFPVWLKNGAYLPHMTVGCLGDEEKFAEAVRETKDFSEVFRTTVTHVSVEIIDENEDSTIELNIPFGGLYE